MTGTGRSDTLREEFYEDSSRQDTDATVMAVTEKDGVSAICLSNTLFYPLGGGQPGDTGTITTPTGETIRVVDTRKNKDTGDIEHYVNATADMKPGDRVRLQLDWNRRYAHMRMHTAMHLLGSLIPVPVTGGQVGAEKSRLDFNVGDLTLNKDALTQAMNQLISAGHDLVFESITDQQLDDNPDLVRTMSVQPPRGAGVIRMVRINGVDYQPCGGTHVANTREIGPVRISKIENKGKRNRRVHLVFDQ